MSIRHEQYRSLHYTRKFLCRLLCKPMLKTSEIREEAARCLRHYPLLEKNGEPIFSNDPFSCPSIEEDE